MHIFATVNRNAHFAGLSFAILMTFNGVVIDAFVAQFFLTGNVFVLDKVTIVGHRTQVREPLP